MRKRAWSFAVWWFVFINMAFAQQPVSLELQSKAGEKITGVIADPVMDAWLNPAMMDYQSLTVYTGGTFDDTDAPDELDLPLNNSHFYVFLPLKSWTLGAMADGQLHNNYFDFQSPWWDLDEVYNHRYQNMALQINKQLTPELNLGFAWQRQEFEKTEPGDRYIDESFEAMYHLTNIGPQYTLNTVKAGLRYQISPDLSINPVYLVVGKRK